MLLLNALSLVKCGKALKLKWKSSPSQRRAIDFGFWLLLFLFVAIPGAYLEYPSDSFEHFYRVWSWNAQTTLNNPEYFNRFSNFLSWTLVFWLPSTKIFSIASFLSAFWLFLLGLQIYRFLRSCELDQNLAKIGVFGFYLTFGVSIFSIRYYALASTLVAMMAFLESLVLIQKRPVPIWKLIGCLILMFVNHTQELGFFAIGASTYSLLGRFHCIKKKMGPKLIFGLVSFAIASLILGYFLRWNLSHFYRNEDLPYISKYGTFVLWNPSFNYFQAFGLTGILGSVFASIYFRKIPFLAALTLAPPALLMFPPFVILYSMILPTAAPSYRLLYMMPAVFMVVFGFYQLAKTAFPRSALWITTLFIVILGTPYRSPFYGKLKFHFNRPTPERKLEPLLSAAEKADQIWKEYPRSCKFVADDTTDYLISTYRGDVRIGERLDPRVPGYGFSQLSRFYDYARSRPNVCGFVIGDNDKITPGGESWVADAGKHWSKSYDHKSVAKASFPHSLSTYRQIFPAHWKEIKINDIYSTFVMPKSSDEGMTWRIYGMEDFKSASFLEIFHFNGQNHLVIDTRKGKSATIRIPTHAAVPHNNTIILESDIPKSLRQEVIRNSYSQPFAETAMRINEMRSIPFGVSTNRLQMTLDEDRKDLNLLNPKYALKAFKLQDIFMDGRERFGSIISLYNIDFYNGRFNLIFEKMSPELKREHAEYMRPLSGLSAEGYGKRLFLLSEAQKPTKWEFFKKFEDLIRSSVVVLPRPEYLKNIDINFLTATKAEYFVIPYDVATFKKFATSNLIKFSHAEKRRFEFVGREDILEFFVNGGEIKKNKLKNSN